MLNKKLSGFTLLELMITVAVIAIIASIAYPAYQDYVMRARRADAKAGLLALRQAQEKYRANCVQYADGIHATTRTCVSGGSHNLVGSTSSPDGNYTLSIDSANASTYSLKATATGVQANDTDCATLYMNQDGVKSSKDSDGNASTGCWER